MAVDSITCPNCGISIDIDEVLYRQIQMRFRQEMMKERRRLEDEMEQKRREYQTHLEALRKKEKILEEEQRRIDEKVEDALRKRLHDERRLITEEIEKKIRQEQEEAIKTLQEELNEKSRQVAQLHQAQVEIERLKREKEEAELRAKLEAEKELGRRLEEEKKRLEALSEEKARQALKSYQEAQELKLKEKEEQLKQLKRSLDEAKRKSEQGSMQIQGEALELTIESWLRTQFPFDTVEEVKKGAFGADCVQTVHTRELQHCGVIVYESKNTKAWNDEWIRKLKEDMLRVNADIGVLVTTVYPKGMDRMGWVDGIWVCSIEEFKGSSALLRESLIRIKKEIQKEENKTDKMTLLYRYLTSNEFQMQLRTIVEGFMKMQEELDKERRSLTAAWKRRQKLIDSVLTHTTEMYGALQGIAGRGAIAHIDALELPSEIEEEKE